LEKGLDKLCSPVARVRGREVLSEQAALGIRALSVQRRHWQAACLAALAASSWRQVAFRTMKKGKARLRCP